MLAADFLISSLRYWFVNLVQGFTEMTAFNKRCCISQVVNVVS